MGKKIICMTMFCVVFLLAGCDTKSISYNNFPLYLEKDFIEIKNEAATALLNSGIKDVATFNKEMHLVAYSAKRLVPYDVTFLYEDGGTGKVYPLQSVKLEAVYVNDYQYPEMLKARMTLCVLELVQSQSDSGNIVGAVMNWKEPSGLFGDSSFHSVCDLDGDGTWDYCNQDTSWENSIFYTHLTAVEDSQPCRVFNEYNVVGIDARGGITQFKDGYLE